MMTKTATSFAEVRLPASVVTIGTFDGVHLGHEMLIGRAIERARELGLPAVIVSFEPIPASVLRPDRFRGRICGAEEKQERLLTAGADLLLVITFDLALSELSAEEFIIRLLEATGMRELWVGEAFALGKSRAGDTAKLTELGRTYGFDLRAVSRLDDGAGVISSSRIRECLLAGDVEGAATLLGRSFVVRGEVVVGHQLGRTIGYPTANVVPPEGLVQLADGIYASTVLLPDDARVYLAMTYVGTRPSVNTGPRVIETHLLDFDADLYGQVIDVSVMRRFRPDAHFPTLDELVAQLRRDEARTREYFAGEPGTAG